MVDYFFKHVQRYVLCLLGFSPLLVTDTASALLLSQSSGSINQHVQADSCHQMQSYLMSLNELTTHIGLSRSDWSNHNIRDLSGAVQFFSTVLVNCPDLKDQVAALYGLATVAEHLDALQFADARFSGPQAPNIQIFNTSLLLLDNSLLSILVEQVNPLVMGAQEETLQRSAAMAVGALTVRAIKSKSDRSDITSPIVGLLELTKSENKAVQLAALNAIRDIGHATQASIESNGAPPAIAQAIWPEDTAETIITQVLYPLFSPSALYNLKDEPDLSPSERLLVDIRVAKIEALSAILRIPSLSVDSVMLHAVEVDTDNDARAEQVVQYEYSFDTDQAGIWLLNYLSSNSDEMDVVRASAIASLERLGSQILLGQKVENQLRILATDNVVYRLEEELGRRVRSSSNSDGVEILAIRVRAFPDGKTGEANGGELSYTRQGFQRIHISAAEIMSRIVELRSQRIAQTITPDAYNSRLVPEPPLGQIFEPQYGNPYSSAVEIEQSTALLNLLKQGLNAQNTDARNRRESNELRALRRRAEIAFKQIYGRNLNRISEAVANSGGEGNDDVQHTAVQALGAVNYRRIRRQSDRHEYPASLKTLTRFLGQSLICSTEPQVRKDAAYALGQIAPYWPDLLDEQLDNYWYSLIATPTATALTSPISELCGGRLGYNLKFMTIQHKDELPDEGNNLVVIAEQGDSYHVRIFDGNVQREDVTGEFVLDNDVAVEDNLMSQAENSTNDSGGEFLKRIVHRDNLQNHPDFNNDPWLASTLEQAFGGQFIDSNAQKIILSKVSSMVEPTRVVDALLLGLEDPNEETIVLSSYALSRYGVALRSALNGDNFLNTGLSFLGSRSSANESTEMLNALNQLKACMKAMVSPTRLGDWPQKQERWHSDELWDYYEPLIQPLNELARQEIETCRPGVLFKHGSDRSAVAAAYILGQIGISDSDANASDEELATINYLLQVLQARDALVQIQLYRQMSRTQREQLADEFTPQYFYRNDSVRDSITGYALGQIHHREETLIQKLIDAVAFPEQRFSEKRERAMSCEFRSNSTSTNASNSGLDSICLDDPNTRLSVIGALEYMGIENKSVQSYVRYLRRLLTQEPQSNVIQAGIPSVVERFASLDKDEDEDAPSASNSRTIDQRDIVEARHILSVPYESILSCTGAAYTLASSGVRDALTVNQLLNFIYVYPQPYFEFTPLSGVRDTGGNICVPELDDDETDKTTGLPNLPPVVQQLVLMKRGAIAALGQATIGPSNEILVDAISEDDISNIVQCLVGITGFNQALLHDEKGCNVEYPENRNQFALSPDQLSDHTPQESEQAEQEKEKEAEEYPPENPEAVQAKVWGLNASQYYLLKRELQEPAIEAIGRLARTEPGMSALCALFISPSSNDEDEDESSRENSGNSSTNLTSSNEQSNHHPIKECKDAPTRIRDELTINPLFELPDGSQPKYSLEFLAVPYRRQGFSLKLEQLEAVALELQSEARYDREKGQKLDLIISQFLVPILDIRFSAQSAPFGDQQAFRHDVLGVLARLNKDSLAKLPIETRRQIISKLGFDRVLSGLAEECLLDDSDFLRQEQVCVGVTTLLGHVWDKSFNRNDSFFVTTAEFLEEVAKPSRMSNGGRDRYSPTIRASAIKAIGKIGNYTAANQQILFRNLNFSGFAQNDVQFTDDEARMVDFVIGAFADNRPEEVIPNLSHRLRTTDSSDELRTVVYVIRQLGYLAHTNDQDDWSWRLALANSSLANDLTDILSANRFGDQSLRLQTIYAMGELRSSNPQVVTALSQILSNSLVEPESIRAAAAYALGIIGEKHPAAARLALPSLYETAIDATTNSNSLRVSAAYAIAKIGTRPENLPPTVNHHGLVNSLTTLYSEIIDAIDTGGVVNSEAEITGAIALYALGELGADNEHVADLFATSLQTNYPSNIRVIAATYARRLHTWNDNLVKALIGAVSHSDIAVRNNAAVADQDLMVRLNAIRSLCLEANQKLDGQCSVIMNDSRNLNTRYGELIERALMPIFWNQDEYPHVRVEAGRIIRALVGDDLDSRAASDQFEDTLEVLELRLDLADNLEISDASEESRGNSQTLINLRGAGTLLSSFSNSDATTALLLILDDLRENTETLQSGLNTINRVGISDSLLCKLIGDRWFCKS